MSPKRMKGMAGLMCLLVLGLLTLGLVMLASTNSGSTNHTEPFYYAKRQAMWLGLGILAGGITSVVNYRHYRRLAWPMFGAALLALVAALVFGRKVNGAARWLVFGPFRFQPSEFAKYALVILLAYWLDKMQSTSKGSVRPKIRHWWWGVFAPIALTCLPAALILREPDFGTTMLLGAVTLALMWVAGSPWQWLTAIVSTGAAGTVLFLVAIFRWGMFHKAYQVQRIIHWWLGDDLQGSNYQQWAASLAFGSGGPWGLGLGNSRMKLGFLPEAHTDFILPVIGEELGLVATLAVVFAFCVVVILGIRLTAQAPDLFGRLIGFGISAVIGVQALINIAVVTNCIPNKGMALPFISYGGSNMLMTLAALGVLMNIFNQAYQSAAPASFEDGSGDDEGPPSDDQPASETEEPE